MKPFSVFGGKTKKLFDEVPAFPDTLAVRERGSRQVLKATRHEGGLYFVRERSKMSGTGQITVIKEKSIVSPFRLNKYFEKAYREETSTTN